MDEDLGERCAQLGFRPQKEIVYNKLLPYADKLDEESRMLFHDIKTNLVKAFLAREIRPGCAVWTSRLHRYMKIYGLKFSKEDHICLIKLFYELLRIPNLEPTRINKFAGTLNFLLKKKELLSRDDLQLEWRPLYELCDRVTKKNRLCIGMYRYFTTVETTLDQLIRHSRTYFPVNATQEILDEFRPKLCPHSAKDLTFLMHYFEIFLPIVMKPSEASLGYQLWFEEFMNLWDVCHNAAGWENQMASLISCLAENHIGYINWEPYVPAMFARFLRTLQLPVSYRQKQSNKHFKIDINSITRWIVSCLGGPSDSVFKHLESFVHTIESYYNVANSGRWTPKIREFLRKISSHFVNRVHNERFKRYTWENQIPDAYKLTDADIDRFVTTMKPCLEQAIYSRAPHDVTFIFNYLACLRPAMIIPLVLDKLYTSMDSLTEPHKLTSAMMSITAVSRYMVQGKKVGYPEGPTHVIPLLMNLLPGIDPNDRRKCFMTFNFIVQFINMMPLINSSEAHKYYDDLTEEEHVVCEASAGLEDFVLQFFDKLCAWIESNSLESTRLEQNDNDRRLTKSESIAESALVSVISAVLTQSAPDIFKVALKKVYNFATSRIFEIKVSGKMVGTLCQVFSRINPKDTARLFIPYLCDTLETLINDTGDAMKEENLNQEILYNLLLLSEVVDCKTETLPYIERITGLLDKALYMTSLQANLLGTRMLNLLMTTLTFTMPTEYQSCAMPFDAPVKEYLSIRDWGKAGNIRDLQIKWYMPGEKEIGCVQGLLNHYLVPELGRLNAYASGEVVLTRQVLRRTFKIILASLGCHTVLPLWKEPAVNLIDSVLDPWAFELIVGGQHSVSMPDGSNVRKTVADVIHKVQKKVLEIDESDTKSIYSIIYIYDILLFNKFRGRDFEFHWKNFHAVKILLEDKLHKHKKHLRHILIDRVMLHQEFRNESRSCSFTETHKQIMLDLFELSISRYSEIRVAAQAKLNAALGTFPYSFTILTPCIKAVLQLNSTDNHEQFKGCLYVLSGPKSTPLIARHDWNFIKEIWPLLVRSQPSEKPSIVNMMDYLVDVVHKSFPTIAIHLEVPENALQVGYALAASSPPVDVSQFASVIADGPQILQEKCDKQLADYKELIGSLLKAATECNLHWRYYLMSVCFLRDLVHPDLKYSPEVVRFFCRSLINESLKIRKIAVKVMLFIMMQNKVKYPKIRVDPYRFSNTAPTKAIAPGNRDDNDWLLYKSGTVPKNAEEWKAPRFVHCEFTGFYTWPRNLYVFDYSTNYCLNSDNMEPQHKEMYAFFSDKSNIDELIKYCSIEEKKGNDKFSAFRFLLYKYLFKMFNIQLLPIFWPHLNKLVEDNQEQSQRCASEIISGLISGCKHWTYEQNVDLWTELIPVLRKAFNNLSAETLFDWASCIGMGVECRDPNRYNWLLEFLMDDPLSESTSFLGCARMYILFCAINQQSWRNAELYDRCFTYFKAHLMHPFQNVRDRISTSLTHVFCKDIVFPNGRETKCPHVADFFAVVDPKLNELYDKTVKQFEYDRDMVYDQTAVDVAAKELSKVSIMDEGERESLIRLFKVAAKYVTGSVVRAIYTMKSEHFILLPLACVFQSNEVDDELTCVCTNLIVVFGSSVTPKIYLPHALKAIAKVATCPFWSARAVIAEFIPVFVFHNMAFIIHTNMVQEFLDITLLLLEDVQPEVRVKASHAISGFLHVKFIKEPIKLLEAFRKKAKTKLKSNKVEKTCNSKIRVRHAGVLGLCSYISASPYDVPDYMPALFGELGPHLNDPQPIPATIRKTLGDFKRTHHANWDDHKLKFTENELSVLTDLTVPPSYYA